MMRASVLLLLAPIVIGGCRDNPGFQFHGGELDTGSGETSAGEASSESSAGETGAAACEPVAVFEPDDICGDWTPIAGFYANFSGFFAACAADDDIHVKREGDALFACADAACADCDDARSVPVGSGSVAALTFDAALPRDGSCSRFVHRGAALPDSPDPCNSVAYALLDSDDPGKLRFAVAYNADDPFVDLAPELGLTVTPDSGAACPVSTPHSCGAGAVVPLDLAFRFGDCEVPAASQRSRWKDITVDGADYELEVRSAYQCLVGSQLGVSWFVRLVP